MPTLTSGGEGTWIVVDLLVKNLSNEAKEAVTVDLALPMKIVDAGGNELTADGDLLSAEQRQQMGEPLLFEETGKLTPGEKKRLAPGQEVTGNIWFSVSTTSTGLKLQRSATLEETLVWPLEQ